MTRRETKADLLAEREQLRRQNTVLNGALHYLMTGARPEWTETIEWDEQRFGNSERTVVTLEAFGLARADGGIVVARWRFKHSPQVLTEAFYMLDATRPAARAANIRMGRVALADAYARLYAAHCDAMASA